MPERAKDDLSLNTKRTSDEMKWSRVVVKDLVKSKIKKKDKDERLTPRGDKPNLLDSQDFVLAHNSTSATTSYGEMFASLRSRQQLLFVVDPETQQKELKGGSVSA